MNESTAAEQLILVDAQDRELGFKEKLEAHVEGALHRAFSVFVFDAEKRLLLQKRARTKYHSGGLWSNTACGHPRPGETTAAAARRRLREEMGFDCELRPAFEFVYRAELDGSLVEHEYDHVFVGTHAGVEPAPDAAEVEGDHWRAFFDGDSEAPRLKISVSPRGNTKMGETKTRDEKLAKLREIVKAVDICMLTTVEEGGGLHSRPMSNNREVEFDGDLWFFTYGSSHKADEVGRVPKVNASFADVSSQQYASVSGRAEIVRDRAKIEELWQPQLKAWFPEGMDTPDIALLKVTADHAEYWDGSQSLVSHAVSLVSSLVTGEPADFGENEKLELK